MDAQLVARIKECLAGPVLFAEILRAVGDVPYRAVLEAWSEVRSTCTLDRDEHGRYWLI